MAAYDTGITSSSYRYHQATLIYWVPEPPLGFTWSCSLTQTFEHRYLITNKFWGTSVFELFVLKVAGDGIIPS